MGKTNTRPALYDTLTGLPKLNLLKIMMHDYFILSSKEKANDEDKLAVVFLDINNYQYINEAYGEKAAEDTIKYIANYLLGKVNKYEYIAKVAKDKFVLLLTEIKSIKELYDDVYDIINNGTNTYSSSLKLYVTMSAGISIFPEHGKDIDTLVKKAETAVLTAKKAGEDIYIYSDELQKDIINQVQMINKLNESIAKAEFELYYQPEFNLKTNEIIGVEALIRWPQPNGYISPEIFIPIAEKSKQIFELERWIINKALQRKAEWEKEGLGYIELSINLSSKSLESESNFRKIEKIITSHDINYSGIVFEITETVLLTQVDQVIDRLNRLRSYGIRFALDDFGTGYSSLTHIMKLPIDIIKIDKSFIKSIPDGTEETVITQNILTMAHDLNYKVVAEGIETQKQLDYLRELSCERGQGFHLCKPIPYEQLEIILRQ
jgi:diguanylate cyclase (GGDEF)-like protein